MKTAEEILRECFDNRNESYTDSALRAMELYATEREGELRKIQSGTIESLNRRIETTLKAELENTELRKGIEEYSRKFQQYHDAYVTEQSENAELRKEISKRDGMITEQARLTEVLSNDIQNLTFEGRNRRDAEIEELRKEIAAKDEILSRVITENDVIEIAGEIARLREVVDELKAINFWKRLEMFVSDVGVNDAMSEEEKEMILRIARNQIP